MKDKEDIYFKKTDESYKIFDFRIFNLKTDTENYVKYIIFSELRINFYKVDYIPTG